MSAPARVLAPQPPCPEVPYRFDPRPYQERLFRAMDSGLRRAICVWHRRSGKDKGSTARPVPLLTTFLMNRADGAGRPRRAPARKT